MKISLIVGESGSLSSILHFGLVWISAPLCTGGLLALELVSLGPDSSGDTGSGIGSESDAGNNHRLPTLFFFRSATYTSYYSYMQLNKLFTIMTFPACMVHVLPLQSYIPNLLVVFQLVFHNNDLVISLALLTRARSHVGAPWPLS